MKLNFQSFILRLIIIGTGNAIMKFSLELLGPGVQAPKLR